MKKVIIATPCYDGKLYTSYVNSLIGTLSIQQNDYIIFPLQISNDSLLCKVRNNFISIAINNDVDELVFIDSDISWDPSDFFKLLSYDVDFIGGLYRQKTDMQTIMVYRENKEEQLKYKNGLLDVFGIGMGFTRLSKKCFTELYNSSENYYIENNTYKNVFEVSIIDGEYTSEDITVCRKWANLSDENRIYIDKSIKLTHIGNKEFSL